METEVKIDDVKYLGSGPRPSPWSHLKRWLRNVKRGVHHILKRRSNPSNASLSPSAQELLRAELLMSLVVVVTTIMEEICNQQKEMVTESND
jgi:hypothetical protein